MGPTWCLSLPDTQTKAAADSTRRANKAVFRQFQEMKTLEPRFEPAPEQAKKLKSRNFIRNAGRRVRKIKDALLDDTLAFAEAANVAKAEGCKEKTALKLPSLWANL